MLLCVSHCERVRVGRHAISAIVMIRPMNSNIMTIFSINIVMGTQYRDLI